MAVYLLRKHQIFMLALVGLRVEGEVAQVLVVPQPPLDHGFSPISPEKMGKVQGRKALTKGG
jgi:hypothetical protein